MNLKKMLCLLTVLLSSNLMASIIIPVPLADRHVASCPDFKNERGRHFMREKYLLPKNSEGEQKELYVLGCEMYAYNSLTKAYIVDKLGKIEDVFVAEPNFKKDWVATSDLMGGGYDVVTRTLGTFQKGRGIGDCGSAATYYYDPDLEKFVLMIAWLKMECDGDFDSEWPVIYKKED